MNELDEHKGQCLPRTFPKSLNAESDEHKEQCLPRALPFINY